MIWMQTVVAELEKLSAFSSLPRSGIDSTVDGTVTGSGTELARMERPGWRRAGALSLRLTRVVRTVVDNHCGDPLINVANVLIVNLIHKNVMLDNGFEFQ
jgi:hypothetical protein